MKPAIFAIALALMSPIAVSPAAAQQAAAGAATPAQQKAAGAFIDNLANQAFAVLQDKSLTRAEGRAKFRALLRANFDVDGTGLRLIRSYRAPNSPIKLTDAQIEAYRAALPDFVVNTYSDRLYDFATAKVSVVRTVPRGNRGDVDVYTRITDPKGGKPIDAIWQVKAGAKPLVSNITVNGVNVALTQEADFKAYIEKNGFDALVDFMKRTK
ncbi:ABC transporter substrate-binding protein [Sandaracinobacter sp. RS1-74]|uniref:MlaC/ttg2D family ABC transporter substrate-binding protein n=1 Tax=Sandaracinobacteroides sayramensis TaxID=2913411 RepID=UPI001EDC45BB|nr:ABC transporter substrate-binding protein [Sandaracinobacteroides sayramensis]MCG2841342.1 ABC transporter substrate-binding protein [Sandaracinobacteroides sayramensis]